MPLLSKGFVDRTLLESIRTKHSLSSEPIYLGHNMRRKGVIARLALLNRRCRRLRSLVASPNNLITRDRKRSDGPDLLDFRHSLDLLRGRFFILRVFQLERDSVEKIVAQVHAMCDRLAGCS